MVSTARSRLFTGNAPFALAGSPHGIAVKVRLLDDNGRPVAGKTVQVAADNGACTVTQGEATDARGYTVAIVRSNTPCRARIWATVLN